jgi:putative membrane protein
MYNKRTGKLKLLSIATVVAVSFVMTASPVLAESTSSKDETVYVVTDSAGEQTEAIVSDHLVNANSAKTINDLSNLKDIENVKGDEKFSTDGDNLTWSAEGNDIYYQGKTDKKAPITLDIKYYLDGKLLSGSDLQGKSGDVKIVINYENNATVSGTKVPFVAITGFVADDDMLQNVEVSSGKVIDDGEKQFIVAMAMPGLTDSISLSTGASILTNQVEITGTAKKFDVEDMMTVVTSDVFKDIDTGSLGDLNFDDQIKELDEGTQALVEGSTTLYNGVHLLANKSDQLSSGIGQLNSGASALLAGSGSALEGSQQLSAGAASLSSNMGTLSAGANSVASGTSTLKAGLQQVQAALNGDGTTSNPGLVAGAQAVSSGMDAAATGLAQTIQADQGVLASLKSLYEAGAIDQDTYTQLAAYLNASINGQTAVKASLSEGGALKAGAAQIAAGAVTLQKSFDGDGTAQNPGIVPSATQLESGASQVATGLTQATAGANSISQGAASLAEGEDQLTSGAESLAAGMTKLNDSTGALITGINKLDLGAKQLQEGTAKLYKEGISKIVDLYNSELKGLTGNLDSVLNAGKNYNTFTELPDGMTGSVKFIYKTEITK